jgi:hypothetical protein
MNAGNDIRLSSKGLKAIQKRQALSPPQSTVPRKCLRLVCLNVRGEVAEWPKAAVC